MLPLLLQSRRERPLKVLCLGAHSDDIEIGCGGAILALLEHCADCEVYWNVFSGEGQRREEASQSAQQWLAGTTAHIHVDSFRDGFLPVQREQVKERFEAIGREFEPDVVFTHDAQDSHQDHRLVHELTWNTFRDHLILQYEIPKYEGDLHPKSMYVPLSIQQSQRKLDMLMQHFATQRNKDWFDERTFQALMRLRGLECRSPSGFAEAFAASKCVLKPQ